MLMICLITMLPCWWRSLVYIVLPTRSCSLVNKSSGLILLHFAQSITLIHLLWVKPFLVIMTFFSYFYFFLLVVRMLGIRSWSSQRDSGLLSRWFRVFGFVLYLNLIESEIILLCALHKTYYWLSVTTNYDSLAVLWNSELLILRCIC